MKRSSFLQHMAWLPLIGQCMKLNTLGSMAENFAATDTMPALFLGHGSPMNAIEDNVFSRGWQNMGKNLPKPNAILVVSAHWETRGTLVTAMDMPRTIHDFGGFPRELFAVQYPAPGSPELAAETKKVITSTEVELDHAWGLDHGSWSVVKHLFPNADVPVVQLSLDRTQGPQYHYELAKQLNALRRKGVLIVGSGNIVHNLGILDWRNTEGGYDWAVEANTKLKGFIADGNHQALVNYNTLGREVSLAVPTPEHYLPLLYILGLKGEKENVSFFNDQTVMGSIAMTSVKIG
ncbi:MAG: 4,5-DOPA dioxygenase extradiol [Saprospiraceae bacterium]|nr:4,5-DOPA dioxygenase extradiol [Saprospiraceae bacterium]